MAKLWDASVAWLNQKLLVKIFSLVSIWLSVLERKIKLLNLLLEASHRKDELVCPVQTVTMNPAQTGQCALFTLQIPSPEWQTHPGQHSWSTGSCLRLCVHTDMFAWYNGGFGLLCCLARLTRLERHFHRHLVMNDLLWFWRDVVFSYKQIPMSCVCSPQEENCNLAVWRWTGTQGHCTINLYLHSK